MQIVESLTIAIGDALSSLNLPSGEIHFEHPSDLKNGDYSTNIALVLSKRVGKNPREIAEVIVSELQKNKIDDIEKVEVAGAGFINFFLADSFLRKSISEIIESKENYGKTNIFSGKKFFIEHTQPNPFKEFHIGHLMNNAIGEAIARIAKANGAEVKTATYHGDVGLHVAKAIWALMKSDGQDITVLSLGRAYAEGSTSYENDEKSKNEIIEINKKIYDKTDGKINKLYEEGRDLSLSHFESLYKRLGNNFDFHFYESETGEIGKRMVLENVGKIFEESEGAVIFAGEKFQPKTHTRVFLNKEVLPTYEAKEIGLAKIKKEKYSYDTSITVTANEQDAFFDVVEVAIGEVFPDLKGKLKHLSHGMLRLPSGKMSSRTGTIISAENLIDQVKEKISEKMSGQSDILGNKEKIVEEVSLGAIKYSILRQAVGGDIIFDFDKSLSFEGDSGPYLQYTAVRSKSVLEKAKELKLNLSVEGGEITGDLERMLYRFPEVVAKAGEENAPHVVVTFLVELSSLFNSFYANNKIIDGGSDSSYKLALTRALHITLKNGLNVLGIPTPERM